MCKVLMMVGVQNPANAKKFMEHAKVPMSVSDRDGIGYAVTKSDGSFFSERWHKNDHFMSTDKVIDANMSKQLEQFKDRLPINATNVNYSVHGTVDFNDVTSVLMHTRMATCGREFMNTHPFIIDDNVLIHNGVIRNSYSLTNKISTCDSETALNSYLDVGVNKDVRKAQAWLDTLQGYWAFGIFSTDNNGNRILDIVRSGANLYFCRVLEIGNDSLIVATTKGILEDTIKACNFTLDGEINFLAEHHIHRFNAVTGELMYDKKLQDSELNKPVVFKGWNNGSSYGSENTGWSGKGSGYRGYSSQTSKTKTSNTFNQRRTTLLDYGYGEDNQFQEDDVDWTDEALILEMCSDVTEPLIDMLYLYDEAMGTSYGFDYEELQVNTQTYLKDAFKDKTMTIVDIMDMIDELVDFNLSSKQKV